MEAHGTGTQLGDPIEFRALTRAFAGAPTGSARTLPASRAAACASACCCSARSRSASIAGLLAARVSSRLMKVRSACQTSPRMRCR
ncbi:hypothetical protein ABZ805_29310 [Saccharopolyspora sp. NPDC047091]|uniref:hypothetical protein n=1 Tax=Saccharopolyspora sp. NPDC047091 TaxID=3155924 RepID=UPI0033F461CF